MNAALLEGVMWTLVHSLWQQGVVAALMALFLRGAKGTSASARYVAACLALVLAALLPVATLLLLTREASAPIAPPAAVAIPMDPTIGALAVGVSPTAEEALPAPAATLVPHAELIVMLWLTGVLFFGARLLGGWIYLQRLRWVGLVPPDSRWRRMMEELAPRLGVYRPVWLYESRHVTVPTLIGWLRPVVLLPMGMLTGLTPQQIEAILAHELAHVRRHDYLVNLVQSLVEVFFYYSPGVWYLSKVIREEREFCCDDLAITVTGNPLALGRALLELQRQPIPRPVEPALAATGGALLSRIQRMVRPPAEASPRRSTPAMAPLVGLAVAMMMLLPMAGIPGDISYAEPFTPATHESFLRGRRVVTLQAHDITLREACDRLTELSALEFTLPPNAAAQRVRVDFANVSANMVAVSIFNLLEMDHPLDPDTGRYVAAYWPESGPRSGEIITLSLPYFHARQTMFLGLKHAVSWSTREQVTLAEGLRRLSELGGMTFAYSEPELADLVVGIHLPNGTVREALHQMLRQHGLKYRYLDDSRILIER